MPTTGILDWRGANLRDLFCTTPKVLKIYGELFWNKKILGEEIPEGDPPGGHKHGGAPLGLVPPLAGLRCPSYAIWRLLSWKKSKGSFGYKAPPSRGET